ncbi:MAG: membrane protease YdiL (CAAX protease family) [Myxococcota bacterium]|jgi:membrane protease YdiL (CAAX protease family)
MTAVPSHPERIDRPQSRRRQATSGVARYLRQTREPATIALALVPLVLIYGLGVQVASPATRSGVDMVTQHLQRGLSETGYILVQLGLVGALIGFAAHRLRDRTWHRMRLAAPIIGESALYGFLLGGILVWLLNQAALLSTAPMQTPLDLFDHAVLAAGAGLHEEFLFRLLLIPALATIAIRVFDTSKTVAVVVAVVLSSLLFAAAHHIAGEPIDGYVFAFRALAGAAFAGLFLTRGFAVTAWTHASYDLFVLAS